MEQNIVLFPACVKVVFGQMQLFALCSKFENEIHGYSFLAQTKYSASYLGAGQWHLPSSGSLGPLTVMPGQLFGATICRAAWNLMSHRPPELLPTLVQSPWLQDPSALGATPSQCS